MTNLRHVSKVRRMCDALSDDPATDDDREPDPPYVDHGRHLDFAYDPGAGGWWMAS